MVGGTCFDEDYVELVARKADDYVVACLRLTHYRVGLEVESVLASYRVSCPRIVPGDVGLGSYVCAANGKFSSS